MCCACSVTTKSAPSLPNAAPWMSTASSATSTTASTALTWSRSLPPPRTRRFRQHGTDRIFRFTPSATADTAMPYFVYRISPDRKLTLLDTFAKFKDAKDHARSLRAQQASLNLEIGRAHV